MGSKKEGDKKGDDPKYQDVPAYAISFPKSSNHNPVSYLVNKVFMEDYFGDEDESDELEEGYE